MELVRSRLGLQQVSQRRLCRVLGQSRSTQRYHRRKPDDDRRLIEELRRWCEWHPRFGSERVHQLLLGTGWRVNFKRVHRLAAAWSAENGNRSAIVQCGGNSAARLGVSSTLSR